MRDVIFRLGRPVLRLLGRDDRGAIGALVVVLIGSGVLLGMGAIVIDLGRLYQNRAELQNGADAAAVGVAKNCALSISTCTLSNATSTAVSYADLNASQLTGHSAGVYGICVSVVGSSGFTVGACPSPPGTTTMTDCPSNPAGTNYVDVKTYTQVGSSHVLPPALAQNGSTVYACAQAEWGQALQSNSLALTLSTCAWQALTGGGSPFGTLIPVYLKGKLKTTCLSSNPSAGSDMPGGFDWLQPTSPGTCTTYIDLTTDTTFNNTGANVTEPCKQALYTDIQSSATVFLPIFDCDSTVVGCPGYKTTGANAIYHISGLAGFVPTGYSDLSGPPGQDNLPKAYGNNSLCNPPGTNDPCIEGYFKPGIDPVSDLIGGGTNFGAITVKLSG
jgi:Flp pilus assembly protein TadG